jgi:hypothetical protein
LPCAFSGALHSFSGLFNTLSDALAGAFDTFSDTFSGALDALSGALTKF